MNPGSHTKGGKRREKRRKNRFSARKAEKRRWEGKPFGGERGEEKMHEGRPIGSDFREKARGKKRNDSRVGLEVVGGRESGALGIKEFRKKAGREKNSARYRPRLR